MSRPTSAPTDLNLLATLDILLEEGSVGGAAQRLGLSPSAVSRALAQLRKATGDAIFTRSAGQRMVPTVRAQAMREPVREVLARARALLSPEQGATEEQPLPLKDEIRPEPWRSAFSPEAGRPADAVSRFMGYVRATGAGAGARSLTLDEADDAFSAILAESVHPEQVGALLIALHRRGETASELGGFIRAARRIVPPVLSLDAGAALDWPVYISPRGRHPFWFLQAAALVARAGHPVILHGHSGSTGGNGDLLALHCRALGIRVASSLAAAKRGLGKHGIVYLPLAAFAAPVIGLLRLRRLFGLHTLANIGVRHLNPLRAPVSLIGAHRPSYPGIHADALRLLGDGEALIGHGGRGVIELGPSRGRGLQRFAEGDVAEIELALSPRDNLRRGARPTTFDHWLKVWRGQADDSRAVHEIMEMAAVALMMATRSPASQLRALREQAAFCWDDRQQQAPAAARVRTAAGRRSTAP